MKRNRGFTIAETLSAGASTVFVGGIAIAGFLATSSASALAKDRHTSSKDLYRASVMLRKDIEDSKSSELVSPTDLKLIQKDPATGVETLVEYRLNSATPPCLERLVNGTVDPMLTTRLEGVQMSQINDGCVAYELSFPAVGTEPGVIYKGEVKLRNWVKQ